MWFQLHGAAGLWSRSGDTAASELLQQKMKHAVTVWGHFLIQWASPRSLTLRIQSSREACCLSWASAPAGMRARWSTGAAPGWGPGTPAGRRGSAAVSRRVRRSERLPRGGCGGDGVRAAPSLPPGWTWRFSPCWSSSAPTLAANRAGLKLNTARSRCRESTNHTDNDDSHFRKRVFFPLWTHVTASRKAGSRFSSFKERSFFICSCAQSVIRQEAASDPGGRASQGSQLWPCHSHSQNTGWERAPVTNVLCRNKPLNSNTLSIL